MERDWFAQNWPQRCRAFYARHRRWLLKTIADYVAVDSPTAEPDRVDALAGRIEHDFREAGGRVASPTCRPRPVCIRFGSAKPEIGLVFHHDTVWPSGAFPREGIENGKWFGPGIFDMKANIPLCLLCLRFLKEHRPDALPWIIVVSSPDEEILGEVSLQKIPGLLGPCRWALVFEPPLPGGGFKIRRKGVGRVELRFEGLAAHAGNHYLEGRSALKAAARFLLAAEDLCDHESGFTVNAGLLSGGSAANTRPAHASLVLDVRVKRSSQWRRFLAFLRDYRDPDGLQPIWREPKLVPPMNAEHEGWDWLKLICEGLSLPFGLGEAGGGSDGSHLSASGIKVFDGLGVPGAGEHAENEHILPDSLETVFIRNVLLILTLVENLEKKA